MIMRLGIRGVTVWEILQVQVLPPPPHHTCCKCNFFKLHTPPVGKHRLFYGLLSCRICSGKSCKCKLVFLQM